MAFKGMYDHNNAEIVAVVCEFREPRALWVLIRTEKKPCLTKKPWLRLTLFAHVLVRRG
jgi:hypothetical protein